MDLSILQRLEELERQLAQVHVRGKVIEVDYETHRAKVQYGENQTTGWLTWMPLRAGRAIVWWPLEVGEAVTVLSPGDLTLGQIYPASYQNDFPAPSADPDLFLVQFDDTARISYQRTDKVLDATLPDGGKATLNATGGIKLVGDTEIDGNLKVTKDTAVDGATHSKGAISSDDHVSDKTSSIQTVRDTYNGHDHAKNVPPPAKQMK